MHACPSIGHRHSHSKLAMTTHIAILAAVAVVTVQAMAASMALELMPTTQYAEYYDPSIPTSPMPDCLTSWGGVEVPYYSLSTGRYLPRLNTTTGGDDATMGVPVRMLREERFRLVHSMSLSNVCKSNHSEFVERTRRGYYVCTCKEGYIGDPNLADGCKALSTNDSYHGNPYVPDGSKAGGRTNSFKGTNIIIMVASGMGLVSLAATAYCISFKFKHWRAQRLKNKYVQRNRRQLLQQLSPQRTDIAEKMIITLKELEKATNNFDKDSEIGSGGHGIIYKGVLSDLRVVAIKKPKMVNQKEIDEFINEIAILSQINHRNVVRLYGCCLETEVPMLVYEFISKGTLHGHLYVEGPISLSWDDRLRISVQVAKSLSYLHSTISIPIIHRDVKPANILLDDTLIAKLADFGSSRYIPSDRSGLTTVVQGTRGYMDPMYFRTCRLTKKSDVYSFGVMLIEVMTRKKPYTYITPEGNGLVADFATLFAEGNLSQILDPQVMDEGGSIIKEIARIAVACVKSRREERPTMRQVELRLEVAQSPEEFEANGDIAINSFIN